MEIQWTHVDEVRRDQRDLAEQRIRALAADHSDLMDVRIVARRSGHHRHGGQEIRITCDARGREIVSARTRDDLGAALDEALDVFEREVWRMRHRRTQRRDERPADPPELGIVDRVLGDQGYGFLLTDSGEQVYFHRNAVQGGLEFERLEEGQRVGLQLEAGEKGLQASAVVPAPPGTPSP